MAHAATQPPVTMSPQPPSIPARHNEYFIDRDGIDREVITADICRYLGNDALVRPGVYEDPQTKESRPGYFITAYRNLTSAMIEDLKNDSARWEQERANIAARNNRTVASPVNANGYYPQTSHNNLNASGPRRSNSPATNAIAAPPPPPAQQGPPTSYPANNGYPPRSDASMSNSGLPSNDYPGRRDFHDPNSARYPGHPQPYPGSAPPPLGGYHQPPSAPYGSHSSHANPTDPSYVNNYPPASMPPYSAPPTQAPYGGPPSTMPEYSNQQPYVTTGANLQAAGYPNDRMGASAPPPQNGYAAGQPPSYPPNSGYPYPPPQPPNSNISSHYEPIKQSMDPMYGRGGFQERTNASPVNQGLGLAGPPGTERPVPVPSKSPQGYAPHGGQYVDNRGPYSQPSRG